MDNKISFPSANVKRVKASVIYRLILIGFGIPTIGFCFICGVMGMFGYDIVTWNNQQIHGLLALPTALLIGIILNVIFTIFIGSITCLGLWIYSCFRPLQVNVID